MRAVGLALDVERHLKALRLDDEPPTAAATATKRLGGGGQQRAGAPSLLRSRRRSEEEEEARQAAGGDVNPSDLDSTPSKAPSTTNAGAEAEAEAPAEPETRATSVEAEGAEGADAAEDASPPAQCSCSIGVSSGQAFCGVVGCQPADATLGARREYTLMGDAVNLSARLMGHATKHGLRVLTDQTTHELTKDLVTYRRLEPVMMKGKANLIPIFQVG